MGFLGGFYLFILTRGWVVARATQPKTRLGRVAISQNPTQTRGLTSLALCEDPKVIQAWFKNLKEV
jgi:hypothetical protein